MSHATTPTSHPHPIEPHLPIGTSFHESLAAGAVFVLNHSGGKDSQAMYAVVSSLVPHERIVVVHADLGEVEWPGVQDHIRANIAHEINVVKAVWRDGSEKHLLDMVRRRHRKLRAEGRDASPFPSKNQRYCTSDLYGELTIEIPMLTRSLWRVTAPKPRSSGPSGPMYSP